MVWVLIIYLTIITLIISLLSLYLYKTTKKLSIRGNDAINNANKTIDKINGILGTVENSINPIKNIGNIGNITYSILARKK